MRSSFESFSFMNDSIPSNLRFIMSLFEHKVWRKFVDTEGIGNGGCILHWVMKGGLDTGAGVL
jgi:hypothetical protein